MAATSVGASNKILGFSRLCPLYDKTLTRPWKTLLRIPFLDLNVKLANGRLETDLDIKSTDRHQYLYYMSSHPEHTKRSIV